MNVEPTLAGRPWPTVGTPTLVLPLGSTEQHGPHLPLDTDTVIAEAVAHALVRRLREAGRDAVLAPAIGYGSSGEHEAFAGTISLGRTALEHLLLEFGRSACRWADRLVVVNGHGGNAPALAAVVPRLVDEGRDVAWLGCVPGRLDDGRGPDAHAGRAETSLMLHLQPQRVCPEPAPAGNRTPISELLPRLRRDGLGPVSPTGVLGDPSGATAAEGERLLAGMIEAAWHRLHRWRTAPSGLLLGAGSAA
ncbi:mycofactocin biosynthesis peptidyl-dipeptidase MftE [Georgenia deserti]|uniref:Mycofactocin biosynthesis peptidyl-dipeptidase MftE n=1 Tax=Georgenia deserti TaxID=2093781 RepID=A0ABW4L0Y1_9MICO